MSKKIITTSGDNAFLHEERIGSNAFSSSSVEYWSYKPDKKELVIQYKSSEVFYVYEGVPFSVLFGLLSAESIGSFVAKEVKPNYEFTKVS
jgi:hypothetical protein